MKKLLVLVFGLSLLGRSQDQPRTPKPVQEQKGRYQIIQYQGEMPRMNTFLLDTATGKVWMMVSAPDDTTFWEPMDRVDNEAEEAAYVRRHPKKQRQGETQ